MKANGMQLRWVVVAVVLSVGALVGGGAKASPMIEVLPGAAARPVLTRESLREAVERTGDSDAVRAFAHASIDTSEAMDDSLKAAMHASVDEVLNGRVIDLEITFLSGIPDVVAVCLETHPMRGLAVSGCANTALLVAGFSASVKYRWDLFVSQSSNGHVHQLSAGPGFGSHVNWDTGVLSGNGSRAEGVNSVTLDGVASLEYVYWLARHFGLTAQLDVGASYLIYRNSEMQAHGVPYGKLSVGLAF